MLKKAINLKDAMAAYEEYYSAWANRADARAVVEAWPDSARAAQQLEKAESALQAAENVLDEKLQPLTDALDVVQAKARVRTITARNIVIELRDITDTLDIPKKAMDDITACVDINAQSFPSAYHGVPESTQFKAVYKAGSWRVVDITRRQTCSTTQRVHIWHTDASKAALINRFTVWG